jgi:hypothetical protein
MQCPSYKTVNLVMSERQGIEIDYCPQCRGVWLDRGELDKIIERSAQGAAPAPAVAQRPAAPPPYSDPRHEGHCRKRKRKREGFLSDISDFD